MSGAGPALTPALSPALAARLAKQAHQHKYDHGHALVLAGGPGHGGAARMAARAALRVGAGLVTLGCPVDALTENAAQLNAIMLRCVGGPADLRAALADARINALCLGPGLGAPGPCRDIVRTALGARRLVVLDADALTAHAADPWAFFGQLHGGAVLTPHDGEFARLFPDLAEGFRGQSGGAALDPRREATRQAAARSGAVVLLKGGVTIIADPSGHVAEWHFTGAAAVPWLATAGAGDVLSGIIAGLLARGFSPFQAAEAGAWIHAACARGFGPGLIAEDLPDRLPMVLAALSA